MSKRDHLQSQLSVAHKHIQDMQVTNSDLTARVDALEADNVRLLALNEKMRKALEDIKRDSGFSDDKCNAWSIASEALFPSAKGDGE